LREKIVVIAKDIFVAQVALAIPILGKPKFPKIKQNPK
jgi:hypothetical protein